MRLDDAIAPLLTASPWAVWGIRVLHQGEPVADLASDRVLASASMGKAFLLLAAAEALSAGERVADAPLLLEADDAVGDSGLWQYLQGHSLPFASACVLVGSVSDNSAANALLRDLGLARVQQVSAAMGMPQTLLVDRIRDVRTVSDPDEPSRSRAADLAALMDRIATGTALGDPDAQVQAWLALNTDLSMVASAFDLDPLAHARLRPGRSFFNKTGTDDGIRADAGSFALGGDRWSYAVVANWAGDEQERLRVVMGTMQEIGVVIRGAAGW